MFSEYLPLCELTKIVFYALENLVYLRNIHLCHVFFIFFSLKNIYLCMSWLKWLLPKAYTPQWKGFSIYYKGTYFPLCKLTKNLLLALKCYLPEEFTPLCECLSIFSLKIIYLFASLQRRCFLHEEYTPLLNVFTFVFIDEY